MLRPPGFLFCAHYSRDPYSTTTQVPRHQLQYITIHLTFMARKTAPTPGAEQAESPQTPQSLPKNSPKAKKPTKQPQPHWEGAHSHAYAEWKLNHVMKEFNMSDYD